MVPLSISRSVTCWLIAAPMRCGSWSTRSTAARAIYMATSCWRWPTPRPVASRKLSGRPMPFVNGFRTFRRKSSGRCCATRVSARNSPAPSRRPGCSRLLLHERLAHGFLAHLGPIFGGLRDNVSGLFPEHGLGLLCPEDPKLAVGNRPGLRICFVLHAARDLDGAIPVEHRCVVIRIGDEQGLVRGIREPVGRAVEGSRKFGRPLLRVAVGEIRDRVVAL